MGNCASTNTGELCQKDIPSVIFAACSAIIALSALCWTINSTLSNWVFNVVKANGSLVLVFDQTEKKVNKTECERRAILLRNTGEPCVIGRMRLKHRLSHADRGHKRWFSWCCKYRQDSVKTSKENDDWRDCGELDVTNRTLVQALSQVCPEKYVEPLRSFEYEYETSILCLEVGKPVVLFEATWQPSARSRSAIANDKPSVVVSRDLVKTTSSVENPGKSRSGSKSPFSRDSCDDGDEESQFEKTSLLKQANADTHNLQDRDVTDAISGDGSEPSIKISSVKNETVATSGDDRLTTSESSDADAFKDIQMKSGAIDEELLNILNESSSITDGEESRLGSEKNPSSNPEKSHENTSYVSPTLFDEFAQRYILLVEYSFFRFRGWRVDRDWDVIELALNGENLRGQSLQDPRGYSSV